MGFLGGGGGLGGFLAFGVYGVYVVRGEARGGEANNKVVSGTWIEGSIGTEETVHEVYGKYDGVGGREGADEDV